MYGIDILMKEHENILKFTNVLEKVCIDIMNGAEVDQDFFKQSIDFIREYSDKHHHRKEEKILFQYMIDNLGNEANILVKNGMMVEHDLGRLKVMELETALLSYKDNPNDIDKISIITNSMSYVYLLRRHIEKENNVAYIFAKNNLPKEILEKIDTETKNIEEIALSKGKIEKHLNFLNKISK